MNEKKTGLKECSLVWTGFRSGLQWFRGDFGKNQDISLLESLQMTQDEFEHTTKDTNLLDETSYSRLASEFLASRGFRVVFNDYQNPVNESMTEKEADEFVKKLRKTDSVAFKFKKVKNGSIRRANGTLKPSLLPKHKSVDKERKRRKIPDSIIIYWDLDKEMFRCFRKALFIGYI